MKSAECILFRISSSLSVLYVHGLCSGASARNCMLSSSLNSCGKLVSGTLTPVGLVLAIGVQFGYSIPSGYWCRPGGASEHDIPQCSQVCKEFVHLISACTKEGAACIHVQLALVNFPPLGCSSVLQSVSNSLS